MRLGVAGSDSQGLLKVRDRLFGPARACEGKTEVGLGFGKPGLLRSASS